MIEDKKSVVIEIRTEYDGSKTQSAKKDLDNLGGSLNKVGTASKSTSQKLIAGGQVMQNTGQAITRGVTLPVIALGTATVKMALDFEYGMQKVSTQYGDVDVDAQKLEGTIKSLSREFGVGAGIIQENYYEALSSGIPATRDMAEATELMTANLKLSKAGYTDLGTVVDATTSVLNAYGWETSETNRVANILLKTQDHGKDSVEDLGKSIARVTPIASTLGVSFEQVGASMTALSMAGNPTAQSVTMLRSLMLELSDSNKKGAKSFKEISGQSFPEFIRGGGTVQEAMVKMRKGADEMGVEMTSLFGRSEAGMAGLQLSTKQTAEFFDNAYKDMIGGNDTLQTSFEKLYNTDASQMERNLNNLKVSGIELGEKLVPVAIKLVDTVSDMVTWFSNLSDPMQDVIINTALITATAGPLLNVGGGLIKGIGILGNSMGWFGGTTAVASTKVLGMTGLLGGTTGAMSALVPILGVGALAVGGIALAVHGYNKHLEKINTPITIFDGKSNELNFTLGETKEKVSDSTKHMETYQESVQKAKRHTGEMVEEQEKLQQAYENGNITLTESKTKQEELRQASIDGIEVKEKDRTITKEMYEEYKEAYGDMVEVTKHFNEETGESWETYKLNVSDATREAVETFEEATSQTTKSIMDGWAKRGELTQEGISDIIANENNLKEMTLQGLSEQHEEANRMTNEYFEKIGELGSEAHELELENNRIHYDDKKEEASASFDEMTSILQESYDTNGFITETALNKVLELQKGATSKGIDALTQMELESAVIHEQMKSDSTTKTKQQAQEIVKSLNEQRDGVVSAAKEQKEESYKYAVELRKQGTEEANAKADAVIASADKEYTEVVEKAEGIRDDGLEMLKTEYGDLASDIDANTGDIVGWWDGMFSKWKNWTPENKSSTVTTEYRTVGNKPTHVSGNPLPEDTVALPAYATGTDNARSGWATINERGFEMVELAGGEKIIPHDATKYALNRRIDNLTSGENQQKVEVESHVTVDVELDEYEFFKFIRQGVK